MIGFITVVHPTTDNTKNPTAQAPTNQVQGVHSRESEHDTVKLSNASQVLAMKESGASEAEIAAKLHLSVAEVDADLNSMARIAAKASALLTAHTNH